jgi:Na+-transporting methylmalonyl-CoA/oxaloacetate decarboxylase gamma subunit
MKEKLRKKQEGITLVALVVTIVVLLILAGITIMYTMGENSIFKKAQEAKNKTEDAIRNEQETFENLQDYMNEAINGIQTKPTNGGWTQDKTTVANGRVTLEVGQAVTGYTANGVGNGNWCVLGAENGKLLITTNSNQGTIELYGQGSYVNGVTKLNTESAKFKDTNNMAELARSMNVEDINRVTGYDPEGAKYNEGTNNVWYNKVTYTLNLDGKIHYQGTKYPTTDTTSSYTSFTYWNDTSWIPLESEKGKNSVTLTHNYYYYYPQTLSTTSSSETKVNGSTLAYTLLFAGTDKNYYWLSGQYVYTNDGYCGFGMRIVGNGIVNGYGLYNSNGVELRYKIGLRPVVTLKSNINVTESGVLSI